MKNYLLRQEDVIPQSRQLKTPEEQSAYIKEKIKAVGDDKKVEPIIFKYLDRLDLKIKMIKKKKK